MKQLSIFALVIGLLSCNESGEKALRVNEYFNLDSLLDNQIELLAKSSLKLNKQAILDGELEEEIFDPDTTRLKDEFKIFREFDLNKTNYVGAYEIKKTGNQVRYELKPDQKSPVKYLEIVSDDEGIYRIEGLFFEDKEIFKHKREIRVEFSDGLVSAYSIEGFQDMVMKDTVQFQTKVKFE